MELSKSQSKDWRVLGIAGDLDTQTASELEQEGMASIKAHAKLALDISQTDYISSAGLRVLFLLAKKAEELEHELALSGAADMVKEILEESGIDMFLSSYERLEELP